MPFPFEVPENLQTLTAEAFTAFQAQVSEYAAGVSADESADSATLTEALNLFSRVGAEEDRRAAEVTAAAAARTELAAAFAARTQPEPAPEPEPVPAAVAPAAVAPAAPAVVASTIDEPVNTSPARAALYASSDVPNAGSPLENFGAATALIERRLSGYSSSTRSNSRAQRVGGSNTFKIDGRTLQRHGVVQIRRDLDDALKIKDGKFAMSVLEHAADEKRLSGGSLASTLAARINGGVALTAAAGWCAPSETIYDLCSLETMAGILDLPEVQASRGGFQIPEDGGPDFTSIWNGIGDEGDTILTEYEVENGAEKVCVEIPCPDFVEVRLDVNYLCITGSLLQTRGYPEAVERFTRGALIAFAHKQNASVIARMVAQSGSVVTITEPATSTDAASQILSAVEVAATDMRYRHRMETTATLEVVLPVWSLANIRAAMARRAGVAEMAVTDAQIMAWFAVRSIAPRFVYDWQDQFSGGGGTTPGGSTALTALPATVDFLMYPAGTWVKAVRDVVNLDTVYDNALLTQNQYTALFVEDGFNVLKMCVDSRLYRTALNPAGVTGCCP